ncbi:nucleoside triphosphate pyrophosphohydrolase [Flindersiella endophytica]
MSGRIVFLLSSPRVAPGLYAWAAWEALRGADAVLIESADHPQRAPIEAAGVSLEIAGAAEAPFVRAQELVARAAAGEVVVWVAAESGDSELAGALALRLASVSEAGQTGLPELEVLLASYDLPGARMLDLIAVMDRLRNECAWVQEQTPRSLVRYLVEEAYETVEAIETGDRVHLREELGDLLFQVVFHARIAQEDAAEPYSIDEIAADLTAKLIRRNPHVFGSVSASDAAEIEANWDELKAAEKARSSAVEGVPLALPALGLADKLLERTAKAGLEVPLRGSEPGGDLGDALLQLAADARAKSIDPEQALRDAIRRYIERIRAAESS